MVQGEGEGEGEGGVFSYDSNADSLACLGNMPGCKNYYNQRPLDRVFAPGAKAD